MAMAKVLSGDSREVEKRRSELDSRLKDASLKGAWQRGPKEIKEAVKPRIWRWHDIDVNLRDAGELIPIDDVMRMRTIGLMNPSQAVAVGTTKTFGVTIQLLNPGEVTESHRHTSASLYFVIRGKGCFTTAEGEQQFMEPGDLLVQPSWTWHGSKNTGTEPAVWLTSMDTQLNQFLDAYFRDKYPGDFLQPVEKPDGYHMRRMGALRARGLLKTDTPYPIKYRWQDTIETLKALASADESDAYDGIVLEYTNPLSGGPTTETLGCRIQMIRPGEKTKIHRHTGNTIYHVVQGAGESRVGTSKNVDEVLRWSERDCFLVSSWQWHCFENKSATEPAILFSVSDRPVLEALRLHREED
jgi:gentisate 1,2-dioxygenase